jgi:hypothetical protein
MTYDARVVLMVQLFLQILEVFVPSLNGNLWEKASSAV